MLDVSLGKHWSLSINWTDALIYLLIIFSILWLKNFRKTDEWGMIYQRIIEKPRYLVVLMILAVYATIGVMDSIHLKSKTDHYSIYSVLDFVFGNRAHQFETTYSAPFALHSFSPSVEQVDGTFENVYPRLQYAGTNLKNLNDKYSDIAKRSFLGFCAGLLFTGLCYAVFKYFSKNTQTPKRNSSEQELRRFNSVFWVTIGMIFCLLGIIAFLTPEYHILGTDKVGRDVFYIAVKSIRTGLIIGTVTMLVTLPFALLFGMWAGYFGGWVGDVIQYTYTTLSSIPGVLLIAGAMLSFQIMVQSDPDLRLVILCVILGVTSWTTLCRLLRAETLKLRESDFVQSAIVLGSRKFKILRRHILPNLMHIVIITAVLDFSGLVLAEAVLSYVGVGVDPTAFSWGNMINASRLEMARLPVVWWSLSGALVLMFTLVFSANIFADALQEALNPRRGVAAA